MKVEGLDFSCKRIFAKDLKTGDRAFVAKGREGELEKHLFFEVSVSENHGMVMVRFNDGGLIGVPHMNEVYILCEEEDFKVVPLQDVRIGDSINIPAIFGEIGKYSTVTDRRNTKQFIILEFGSQGLFCFGKTLSSYVSKKNRGKESDLGSDFDVRVDALCPLPVSHCHVGDSVYIPNNLTTRNMIMRKIDHITRDGGITLRAEGGEIIDSARHPNSLAYKSLPFAKIEEKQESMMIEYDEIGMDDIRVGDKMALLGIFDSDNFEYDESKFIEVKGRRDCLDGIILDVEGYGICLLNPAMIACVLKDRGCKDSVDALNVCGENIRYSFFDREKGICKHLHFPKSLDDLHPLFDKFQEQLIVEGAEFIEEDGKLVKKHHQSLVCVWTGEIPSETPSEKEEEKASSIEREEMWSALKKSPVYKTCEEYDVQKVYAGVDYGVSSPVQVTMLQKALTQGYGTEEKMTEEAKEELSNGLLGYIDIKAAPVSEDAVQKFKEEFARQIKQSNPVSVPIIEELEYKTLQENLDSYSGSLDIKQTPVDKDAIQKFREIFAEQMKQGNPLSVPIIEEDEEEMKLSTDSCSVMEVMENALLHRDFLQEGKEIATAIFKKLRKVLGSPDGESIIVTAEKVMSDMDILSRVNEGNGEAIEKTRAILGCVDDEPLWDSAERVVHNNVQYLSDLLQLHDIIGVESPYHVVPNGLTADGAIVRAAQKLVGQRGALELLKIQLSSVLKPAEGEGLYFRAQGVVDSLRISEEIIQEVREALGIDDSEYIVDAARDCSEALRFAKLQLKLLCETLNVDEDELLKKIDSLVKERDLLVVENGKLSINLYEKGAEQASLEETLQHLTNENLQYVMTNANLSNQSKEDEKELQELQDRIRHAEKSLETAAKGRDLLLKENSELADNLKRNKDRVYILEEELSLYKEGEAADVKRNVSLYEENQELQKKLLDLDAELAKQAQENKALCINLERSNEMVVDYVNRYNRLENMVQKSPRKGLK